MKEKIHWSSFLQIAGGYIAFCIGSGFATGQEILQFFTAFGWGSLGACAITLVLFVWMGMSMTKIGKGSGLRTDRYVFRYYCGKSLGTFFEWFSFVYLFLCYGISVSALGSAAFEQFGINAIVAKLVLSVLAFVTVLMGVDRLLKLISLIGTLIIVFTLVVGIGGIVTGWAQLPLAMETAQSLPIVRSSGNWALSGLLYGAFMAIVLVPYLVQLSHRAKNGRSAMWGGGAGGFLLILAVICLNLGMMAHLTDIYDKDIPVLALATDIHPMFGSLFAVLLLLGLFSSCLTKLIVLPQKFAQEHTPRYHVLCLVVIGAGLIMGFLPYAELVNRVYSFSGYLGIVLMACMFYRQLIRKGNIAFYRQQEQQALGESIDGTLGSAEEEKSSSSSVGGASKVVSRDNGPNKLVRSAESPEQPR